MLYLRLAGGLGNQLFQLAAADYLANRLNCKFTPVITGLGRYKTPRFPDSLSLIHSPRMERPSLTGWRVLLSDRARCGLWLPYFGINDRRVSSGLSRANLSSLGELYLDGYFQDCWDYQTFRNAIREWETNFQLGTEIGSTNHKDCAIHIRGGDFLLASQHQVVGKQYYASCIQDAIERGFRNFLIVTDDLQYSEPIIGSISKTLPGIRFTFNQGGNSLQDFGILRSAKARIIGNSTFAWWAAALDANESITWSPNEFIRSKLRTMYLPWEVVVDASTVRR